MLNDEIISGLCFFLAIIAILIGTSKSKSGKSPGKHAAKGPQKKTTVTRQTPAHRPPVPVWAEGEDPGHDHALPKESPRTSRVAWGSLDVATGEGEDPDHDHALHTEPTLSAADDAAAPILTGNELVRAFILQEVLKLPDERTNFGI